MGSNRFRKRMARRVDTELLRVRIHTMDKRENLERSL